jgi:hypothetical protein
MGSPRYYVPALPDGWKILVDYDMASMAWMIVGITWKGTPTVITDDVSQAALVEDSDAVNKAVSKMAHSIWDRESHGGEL